MTTLKALRDERDILARHLRNLNDRIPGSDWHKDPLNQAAYDGGLLRLENLNAQIASLENQSGLSNSRSRALFNTWLRRGDQALSAQDWKDIRNTMSEGTPSQGGYAVPTEVAQNIADALKAYGAMYAVSDVLETNSGNPITFPNSDGRTEAGEIISENAAFSSEDISFGSTSLSLYKFSSKIVTVSIELLQDAVNMEAFILKRLVDRLGRIQNTKFTIGSGTGEPQGIVNAAVAGVVGTTGQTSTIIFDNLVDLIHSVDPAYRNSGRACFMLNDSTLKAVQKLTDSSNRPVFLPGFAGLNSVMPSTILGYPVVPNPDMPTMAANAKSVLFGDFSYYAIRQHLGLQLIRIADSVYVSKGQVGFLMLMRAGSVFTDVGGAVAYYQNSAS